MTGDKKVWRRLFSDVLNGQGLSRIAVTAKMWTPYARSTTVLVKPALLILPRHLPVVSRKPLCVKPLRDFDLSGALALTQSAELGFPGVVSLAGIDRFLNRVITYTSLYQYRIAPHVSVSKSILFYHNKLSRSHFGSTIHRFIVVLGLVLFGAPPLLLDLARWDVGCLIRRARLLLRWAHSSNLVAQQLASYLGRHLAVLNHVPASTLHCLQARLNPMHYMQFKRDPVSFHAYIMSALHVPRSKRKLR